MPAYIVRAVKGNTTNSMAENIAEAIKASSGVHKIPVLADDFAEAWTAVYAELGSEFSPFGISSSNEIESMRDAIEDSAKSIGSETFGCVVFGLPNKPEPYTSEEILSAFEEGQLTFTYVNTPNVLNAMSFATKEDPTLLYFGGYSHFELQEELNSLEALRNQVFNI